MAKTIPMPTIKELFNLIKDDNRDAYTQLYRRRWDMVYNLAFKKLGDRSEAEDIAQEIFFQLWRNRSKINSNTDTQYLIAATHYKCLDFHRRRKSRNKYLQYLQTKIVESDLTPVEIEELGQQINKAIGELPTGMHLVFVLTMIEGINQKSIAKMLNMSERTVRNYSSRSKIKLRNKLGGHYKL